MQIVTSLFGHRRRGYPWALCLAAGLLALAGWALPAADDDGAGVIHKANFTLINPTPRGAMRDLSADRPDTTESPITVDAGHFQVEMSVFDIGIDRDNRVTTTVFTLADTNLKVGLTNNTDLQLVFALHTWVESHVRGGGTARADGFADITLRFKVNIWGNDGGEDAFGVMPFIKLPTGEVFSNDHTEGGLIFAYGRDLDRGWSLGLMGEFDAIYDDADDDYDLGFLHTVVFGHELNRRLGAFIEYAGTAFSDPDSDYEATLNGGVTYAVNDDLQLDGGLRLGLTDSAEDFSFFGGFTWRY